MCLVRWLVVVKVVAGGVLDRLSSGYSQSSVLFPPFGKAYPIFLADLSLKIYLILSTGYRLIFFFLPSMGRELCMVVAVLCKVIYVNSPLMRVCWGYLRVFGSVSKTGVVADAWNRTWKVGRCSGFIYLGTDAFGHYPLTTWLYAFYWLQMSFGYFFVDVVEYTRSCFLYPMVIDGFRMVAITRSSSPV